MPFSKGKSGNPKGRPEGSKNKNYLDMSHWLGRADELFNRQKDEEKQLLIVKWAAELIMQKVQLVPATPADSANNALEQQTLLKALERDASESEPNPASV